MPIIFNLGIDEYLKFGTKSSPGTKLICLSGDVKYPGTYEVEMGCTIREILEDIGGGTMDDIPLKAVLLGGAAGTFANTNQLDIPIGYSELREHGLTLGSGAIIVLSEASSVSKTLTSIVEFFKHESCGKCVPCRVGTHHIYEQWKEVESEKPEIKIDVLNQLKIMAQGIAVSSLCPLGQSPILPIQSVLKNCSTVIE